ncbi:MAG: potassium channel family protein [Lachnospiraceae bacterium]
MELPQINKNTSIAVLGLGKFGMSVARTLCENGYRVLCCDKNAILVQEISDIATHAMQLDTTEPTILNSLGIGNYDIVIVAFSEDFEAELLTTMMAKEMGVPFIVAKATGLRQKKVLENIGTDLVVMPEVEMGRWFVNKLMNNDPMDYIHHSDHYEIVEIKAKKEWIGKNLDTLDLRNLHKLNVLTIIRNGNVIEGISQATVILDDDLIIAVHTL